MVKEYILKIKEVSDVETKSGMGSSMDKSKMSEAAKLELNL